MSKLEVAIYLSSIKTFNCFQKDYDLETDQKIKAYILIGGWYAALLRPCGKHF